MKKILSIMLAAVMLIATMAIPAFAATADLTSSLNGLVNVPVVSAIDIIASAEITEAGLTVTADGEIVNASEYEYENGVLTFANDMQAQTEYTISAGGTAVSYTTGYAKQITDALGEEWIATGTKNIDAFGDGKQGYTAGDAFAVSFRANMPENKIASKAVFTYLNMYDKSYTDANKLYSKVQFRLNSSGNAATAMAYDYYNGGSSADNGMDEGTNRKTVSVNADYNVIDYYIVYTMNQGIITYAKHAEDNVWSFVGKTKSNVNNYYKQNVAALQLEGATTGSLISDFNVYYGTEYVAPESSETLTIESSLDGVVYVPVMNTKIPLTLSLDLSKKIVEDAIIVKANGNEVNGYTVSADANDSKKFTVEFADNLVSMTTYEITFDTDVLEANDTGTEYETNSISFETGLPLKNGDFIATRDYFGVAATLVADDALGYSKMSKSVINIVCDKGNDETTTSHTFVIRRSSEAGGGNINVYGNAGGVGTFSDANLTDDGTHSWDVVLYFINNKWYAYAKASSEEQYVYCGERNGAAFSADVVNVTGSNIEELAIIQPASFEVKGGQVTLAQGSVTSIEFTNALNAYSGNVTLTPAVGNAITCAAVSEGNVLSITLSADLEILTEYTVTFANALTDIYGNEIESCTIVTPKAENGYIASTISIAEDNDKYYATVYAGLADEPATVTGANLYIAVYAEGPDGAVYLKDAKYVGATLTSVSAKMQTEKIEIPAKVGSETYFIKAFLWNDDLLPICDSTYLEVE